jgi:hypothetical protein
MAGMNVQGAGDDHAIDIFHVEQATVVVQRLNTGNLALGLIAAAAIDICHGDQIDIRHFDDLIEKVVPAVSNTNHSDPNAIVRAQRTRGRIR